MVLALVWLPVLVVPLVVTLHGAGALAFAVVDYAVWFLFLVEYLIKLGLAVNKWHFVGHHLLDLAMVAVPILRPLRLARLLRVVRLDRVVIVLIRSDPPDSRRTRCTAGITSHSRRLSKVGHSPGLRHESLAGRSPCPQEPRGIAQLANSHETALAWD